MIAYFGADFREFQKGVDAFSLEEQMEQYLYCLKETHEDQYRALVAKAIRMLRTPQVNMDNTITESQTDERSPSASQGSEHQCRLSVVESTCAENSSSKLLRSVIGLSKIISDTKQQQMECARLENECEALQQENKACDDELASCKNEYQTLFKQIR